MLITWSIAQLERNLLDGLVTNVHWCCTATDGDLSASNYGSVGFERGETFTPYENLTQDQVLDWVKSAIEVENIEVGLESHIEAQKAPTTATGVPW